MSNVRPLDMSSHEHLVHSIDRVRERVSACEEGFSEFILATDYPLLLEELEAAQESLSKLGLFELLWAAIEQSEGLLRADRIEDAEHTLRNAIVALRSESGK
jgi:hypothetical protein